MLGGNAKKVVIVKTSVKCEMKYIKLPPNFHFITFSDWLRLTSICWGVMWEASHGIFFVQSKFYKISLPPNFYQRSWATKFSVKAGFHVFYILWIEKLISAVTEETRLYLFHAYELSSCNFVLLVIEKDVSHRD